MEEKFIEKSKEAFIMAIEIYNKPTIKYRVEGFSFFICNAWELMLKAYMIKTKGEQSIYYEDKKEKTFALELCVKKIFTNEKDPMRRNLIKIIELRNTSTHFVIEEYEMIYIPLFQACVLNFVRKMEEFHGINMNEAIQYNFLNLCVNIKSLDEKLVANRYSLEIFNKFIETKDNLDSMIDENNHAFAIKIEHHHFITKDKNKATSFVHIGNEYKDGVKIIKEIKDPISTHKYTMKSANIEITKKLKSKDIEFKMNQHYFMLFNEAYGIKENIDYCYRYQPDGGQPRFTYSYKVIDLIVGEVQKDPENIIKRLKNKIKK